MDEIEKLAHLIDHWVEHNEGHVKTYTDWAQVAESRGRPELAEVLRELARESRRLEALLRKAREVSAQ